MLEDSIRFGQVRPYFKWVQRVEITLETISVAMSFAWSETSVCLQSHKLQTAPPMLA